eukprot:4707533-Amphidinium_carterae.2
MASMKAARSAHPLACTVRCSPSSLRKLSPVEELELTSFCANATRTVLIKAFVELGSAGIASPGSTKSSTSSTTAAAASPPKFEVGTAPARGAKRCGGPPANFSNSCK